MAPRLEASPRHGGARTFSAFFNQVFIRRGIRVVHQNHEDEKNSSEFFDCAPPGAAAFIVI